MIEPELTLIFRWHWEKLLLLEKFEFRREKIVPKCGGSGYKNKTFTAARHYVQKQSNGRHYLQREQGTMYKSSKTLDVQREKSLEKLRKKKMKYVFRRVRTFPKYFSSKSGSVLPLNHFKFPTFKIYIWCNSVSESESIPIKDMKAHWCGQTGGNKAPEMCNIAQSYNSGLMLSQTIKIDQMQI